MKIKYLLCAVAFSALFLSSCDMLGKNSDALIKVADNIKTANNNGIDANNNIGIKISSPIINVSPSVTTAVNVLEKFDSPMVQVKKFVIFEASPSNSKIKREYKKINDAGQIVEQETETVEPANTTASKDKAVPLWVLLLVLLNVVILGVVIRKKSD
jgi:hypothetical protein